MRTTIKNENSKFKATIEFKFRGWTYSYFDDDKEIEKWVDYMEEKHGKILTLNIVKLKPDHFDAIPHKETSIPGLDMASTGDLT